MFPTNKTLMDDFERPSTQFQRPATAIISEDDVVKSTRREYNHIDKLRSKEFYLDPDED